MMAKLDDQINRLGLWAVFVVLISFVITLFLPLDVPDGLGATQAERVDWLQINRAAFILGWINQLMAMMALTAVLLCTSWQIRRINPLRALIASLVVCASFAVFLVPKFIAIWTIPQLAQVSATGAPGGDMAEMLLSILNVSLPYSLYTALDYLGFWLYALFTLLIAGPLFGQLRSSRIAAVAAILFGVAFHGLLTLLFTGNLATTDVEPMFTLAFTIMLVFVVAMGFHFRSALSNPASLETSS
ncbi:hypothetical protein N9506_05795 [Pseudomonadales bacterium]|jgi:hypothetical protein|nr:hypothetical protein [Pseudomonadales bacterium]MDC1314443.1 hypothetical protein [Pseudomonadales bacterium]